MLGSRKLDAAAESYAKIIPMPEKMIERAVTVADESRISVRFREKTII